jgi:YCII-related domain
MPNYFLGYQGGRQFDDPEEGKRQQARWQAWMRDLGDAMINPGTPFGASRAVTASGVTDVGGPDRLTGYSIVRADSMEAAIEIARACPFAEIGTMLVCETMQM